METKIFNKVTAKVVMTVLIFTSFVFTNCESLSSIVGEPVMSLQSVEISKITFTGIEILCKVQVENPNPVTIPFPDIGWEFFINANSFVKGTIQAGQSIKARGTSIIEVPVSFNFLEVFNTFGSLMGEQQAEYKVALDATLAVPILGDRVFAFQHEGVFPIIQLPSVSFKGVNLKTSVNLSNPLTLLNLTTLQFDLTWEVENKNYFAVNVKDLSYNFAINNNQWSSGVVSTSPQLSAGKKTEIPLTITINNLTMVKNIIEIITNGTDVSYLCAGNIKIGADLLGLQDYANPFSFSGTTKLRN